ncbi:MAG: hypothetical protein FWE06_06800 [Oscillospiraceae bacterium]|nr:hypothetical protein [Oscillospiraceae bacterium]
MKKIVFLCALGLMLGFAGCTTDERAVQEYPYETPVLTSVPEYIRLSQERELWVRENFLAWLQENTSGGRELDDVTVARYYGTFGLREVVYMYVDGADFAQAEMTEYVAGYSFWFGNLGWSGEHGENSDGWGGVHIWLHDDGEFMCICLAYERGHLTAEDVGVIWEREQAFNIEARASGI